MSTQTLAPSFVALQTSVVVCALLWLASPAHGAQEYSLEELFRIALERSEQVKISEEDVSISQREKDKAASVFFPRFTAFSDYTQYNKERISLTSGSLVQPKSLLIYGLILDQSLSLGGREFTNYRIAETGIEQSTYNLHTTKEAYLLDVATAYYEVLRAKKRAEISKANFDRLTRYRDAASVRLKVGEVTKTDLLRAEAELSGAESELIRADNAYRLSKAVLARVVGLSGDFEVRDSGLGMRSLGDVSPTALKEQGIADRSDVKSSIAQKRIAADQVRSAKSAYWPTVSIEGVYQRQDPESTLPIDSRDDLFGILSLRFPLFEGGLRRAEVREAESRERQAGLALENLKKSVGIEVDAAYLEYVTQKGVLKSLEDQVAFARENYTSIIKQYEFGLTTSIDVIDSNTLLLTAERQRADAVYGYQLALLRVERATGRLLSTFLSGEPGLKSRTAGFVHHAEASQKPEEERSTID